MSTVPARTFPTWRRCLFPLALWLLAAGVAAGLWSLLEGDRTSQVTMLYIVFPTAVFLSIVWWLFFTGIRWSVRLGVFLGGTAAVVVTVTVLLTFFYRFDGFSGDFVPMFSPRSSTTAEEDFAESYQAPVENPATEAEDSLLVQPGDWPQFRGNNRDGIVTDGKLRTDWNGELPREIWRQKIGPGWGSCCVVDGRVFTQMQIDDDEAVVCYDLADGTKLWEHREPGVRFDEIRAGVGPMATPTFANGKLYTLGATGILNCLNPITGEQYWQQNINTDAGTDVLTWAMTGSPLVYKARVFVIPGSDGTRETTLSMYDSETGEFLGGGGTRAASYSSPTLLEINGMPQVLVFDAFGMAGHNPADGQRLWEFEWTNQPDVNVALPIPVPEYSPGTLFLGSGYTKGSAYIEVTQNWKTSEWSASPTGWETQRRFQLKFGDAVKSGKKIYALNETRLACLDLDDGKVVWQKRGGFGYGQIMLVDDILVTFSDDGIVKFIDPAADGQPELLKFDAFPDLEDSAKRKTWNHPVYLRGQLLLRNAAELVLYDVSQPTGE